MSGRSRHMNGKRRHMSGKRQTMRQRTISRFLYVCFSVCLLAGCTLLSGCAGDKTEIETDRYTLYFLDGNLTGGTGPAGEGALRTESSAVSRNGTTAAEAAEALLSALLRGPDGENLRNPIPDGTVLLSLDLRGSRAAVNFSSAYASLSGVALTLADYAVTLTLTQIPEISLVQITVDGQPLAYRDRQSFTARDVLLLPDGDVVGTVNVKLYFAGEDGGLTPEEHTLSLYEGDTQVEAAVQAVENGPERRDLSPVFPEGFRVRSVRLEEATCFVNLSPALLEAVPPDALSLALRALDMSLCSLENVGEVRYLVDGEFLDQYGGVRLTEPYTFPLSFLESCHKLKEK